MKPKCYAPNCRQEIEDGQIFIKFKRGVFRTKEHGRIEVTKGLRLFFHESCFKGEGKPDATKKR